MKKIKLNILDVAPLNWINVNYDEDLHQGRKFNFITRLLRKIISIKPR